MTVPRSTLRLQFHKSFTFDAAAAQVDYFASLGVSHAYASPITTATSGSTHGYDVVDYTQVNPELGGEEGLRRFVEKLRAHELGLIVDIVPNLYGRGWLGKRVVAGHSRMGPPRSALALFRCGLAFA